MFKIHFIVFLDLINIYTDTKTIKIEAFIANLQAHPVFRAAILNFEFLAGKPRATIWFPLFLNSAYSKTPRCKFSCFYPEVHDMAEKCHISAPLINVRFDYVDAYTHTQKKDLTLVYWGDCCFRAHFSGNLGFLFMRTAL